MAYGVCMPASVFADRLAEAARVARAQGVDAILVTPGPDLRYLVGYDAVPLERLTCLAVPADGDPWLVVPALEELAALSSPVGDLGLAIRTWSETDNPFALVASGLGEVARVAVDDRMWAEKVLRLRAAMPRAEQVLGGPVLQTLRVRKGAAEIDALRDAGAAIDRVHAAVPDVLLAGRTEREVGRDLAELIIQVGHTSVDFVIVASGPNGASPHHEVSDRVIGPGDQVVVDIGGTMPSGYCSDSTRTYSVGEASAEYLHMYSVLHAAQEAGVNAVRPGTTCQDIDRATRSVLVDAGLGDLFIHRTGHGIGLETHEAPYIVEGNPQILEPGMAFSIEPGFYRSGAFGARIEDIVVCTESGGERLNHRTRDLVFIDAA